MKPAAVPAAQSAASGGRRRWSWPLWALAVVGALAPARGPAAEPGPPQRLPIGGVWCPADGGSAATIVAAPPLASVPPGCVGLEVPRSLRQYILGLQLREPLSPQRGMWFAYRPAQVARFWMHRTPQPLDLIFVRDGRVSAIEAAAPPCMRLPCPSYGPSEPVDGVLELRAGEAARRGLMVGSPLRVRLFTPVGPAAPAPD